MPNVQNRAPKNVATALAGTVAQIVQDVVREEGAPAIAVTVRESHPASPENALSAAPAEAPAVAPALPPAAPEGFVRVKNGHVASVLGIEPGEWAWIHRDEAAKYPWAWR